MLNVAIDAVAPRLRADNSTEFSSPRDASSSEPIPLADDRARVAEWYSRWGGPLRRFLAKRANIPAATIDDVAQEAFLRLLRYERRASIEQPQAYLYKTAMNIAAEWAMRGRCTRPHDAEWLKWLASEDCPASAAGHVEMRVKVAWALSMLPPRHQEIIRLQFFQGMTHLCIAQTIGATERSVKRSIVKSYDMLRSQLQVELLQ